MKILFTAYSPLGIGGAEVSMNLLAKGLKERGHDVVIASTESYDGFKTYEFKRFRKIPFFFLHNLYLSRFLSNVIKKENIEIIHAHDRLTIPPAIIAAKKTRIKCVIHFRDQWFMCPKSVSIMPDYKECRECSSLNIIKCFPFYKVPWELYKLSIVRLYYRLFDSADIRISPSNSLRLKLNSVGINKVEVIPNPIYISKGKNIRKELGFSKNDIVVGYIGALNKDKGILNLLRVMNNVLHRNKYVKFLIVGGGRLVNNVTEFANKNKDQVVFLGYKRDVADIYASSDIIVFPSLQESFGRVSIEAMANGKPVVGSDVSGVKDVVNDNVGYLISPLDLGEWEKRIIYLVENKKKRIVLGKNGIKEAKKYDYKLIAKRMENLYKYGKA